jgi:DNA-binding CsgD family transcriptional regulator/tetratricopeptide (TPR) repeat protein
MTGQLISGLAHRPVPEAAADLVSNATDGNPFFALELARFLIDEHRIDRLDESATLPKLEDLRLPESLRHAIDRLLKRLHPDTETLLRLASICGETFDDAILAAATSFEEARLLDAIDLALAGQLIQPAPHAPGYYAFVHPLVQHALADSQAPSRRVRMYRGMAEALIAQDSRTPHPHATQIARFYHQSANLPGSEEGIPYAIAAASQARREYDAARAVRYYRIARDLGVTRPAADQAEILAMLVLAEVEAFQLEDALRTTSEALEAMREAGATLGEQAAFIATAVTALHDAGMPAEAWMPMLNYGLELTPPGDVQTWARLTLLIDRFEIIVEGVINGSRWLGSDARAVEIARSCGDEDLYARSLQPWDLWDREWTEALSARIRTWHKPSAIIRALTVSSADWLYHHGDFRKAQAEFEDLLDISARNFSTAGQAEAYVRLALIQIAFGNLDQAREYEQQARLFVSRLGPGHRLHASLWWVAALLAEYRDGDWEAIAGYFVPYVADPDIARGTIALDDAALAALALVRAGNPAGARQMLTTLASVVARVEPDLWLLNGTVGFAAAAVWELGASGLAPVFRDTARTLLQRGNGDFPCSSLTLAVARMSTLLDEHDTATRAFDRARLALEESGQQPQRAIVDFDQAIAIADHRRGSTSQAIDLMTRAIERFRELGMAPWVARGEAHLTRWAEATDRVDPDLGALSPREIEVLQLVARGMSDKQISDQMFVSPRTVHAHIRNMLAKTRTSNRTELSIWALERDLVSRGADPA